MEDIQSLHHAEKQLWKNPPVVMEKVPKTFAYTKQLHHGEKKLMEVSTCSDGRSRGRYPVPGDSSPQKLPHHRDESRGHEMAPSLVSLNISWMYVGISSDYFVELAYKNVN